MWPDTSGFDRDELCPTSLRLPSGETANLFSSENRKTVARHFRWLKDYGVDVVALQRFEAGIDKSESNGPREHGFAKCSRRGSGDIPRVLS